MSLTNIRHLRAFVAVARLRHFTKAAASVGLSQSALSMSIRQLEEELGVTLLFRQTRNVELTPIGREFVDLAQTVLTDFDEAVSRIRDYSALRRGRVTIAVLPSIAGSVFPTVLKRFAERHPDIRVAITDRPGAELLEALRARRADLAFTFEEEADDLDGTPLMRDRLVLVGRPDGKDREPIAWKELVDIPVIAMAKGTTIRTLIDMAVTRARVAIVPVFEPSQMHTAMSLVVAGLGSAILPSTLLNADDFGHLQQRPLVDPVMERELSVLHLRGYPLSPAAQALLRFLEDELSGKEMSP